MRLLLIGVDGLSYRMAHWGAMPFFRELESRSINHGLLKSFPIKEKIPYTGPCWVSIYTGMRPDQHGFDLPGWIYGDNHFDAVKYRTFFDELNIYDRAVSFTMPITFPATAMPEHVKCVAGFPAMPNSSRLVNDELLRQYIDGYLLDICDNPVFMRQTFACDYQENEKKRLISVKNLCETMRPEVLFLGLTFIDKLNHQSPQSSALLRDAYGFLDNLVFEYVDSIKPLALIICSDHGFRPGIWNNNLHDLDGYYLFTSFSHAGKEVQRDLTYIARAVSDALNLGYGWIGQPIERAAETYSEFEKQLVFNRMKALGYA